MALHNDASGKGTVMPTITVEALQWMQEEMESITAQRDDLEEELEAALEDRAENKATISALEAEIRRLMSDRSFRG